MTKSIGKFQKHFILIVFLLGFIITLGPQPAESDPHAGQSLNVAIIGSPRIINGGTLPTSGGGFNAFNFFNTPVAGLSLTTLTDGTICGGNACDTLVLNVASSTAIGGLGCSTAGLSAAQKTDINTFVANGGKLIVYDSECTFGGMVDYTWLTFPFMTDNPGAAGAFGGVLTIVEDNILSHSSIVDSHFIDTAAITTTDAVGDMNVVDLDTVDPAWCLDLSGTNTNNFTGATHMYAQSGNGLYTYNGLDVDFIGNPSAGGLALQKIWLQELEATADSSLLPCLVSVVGITLDPKAAENPVGSSHVVTAALIDLLGSPQSGIPVTFTVLTGSPNAGTSGACSANGDCTTDTNGEVSFTYTGSGGVGQDIIQACFTNGANVEVCSDEVTKDWITPSLDHFLSYEVKEKHSRRSRKYKHLRVTLRDQFDEAGSEFKVGKPERLYNPVEKRKGEELTPIGDPKTHLVGYEIERVKSKKRHGRKSRYGYKKRHDREKERIAVKVVNQFGEISVEVEEPDMLLVPSLKDLKYPIDDEDVPENFSIDHFKCYEVEEVDKFYPIKVTLIDQFNEPDGKDFIVKKPTRLCSPVEKQVGDEITKIQNPDINLMCYAVKRLKSKSKRYYHRSKGRSKRVRIKGVHVNNQFGALRLKVEEEKELCVPSTKTLLE